MAESKIQELYGSISTNPDLIESGDYGLETDLYNLVSETDPLQFEEWEELIAMLLKGGIYIMFEGESMNEEDIRPALIKLQKQFSDKIIGTPAPSTSPGTPFEISPGLGQQGIEHSCFAHAATNMIIHNVYKFSMTKPENSLYDENNCNQYLNTSRPLSIYDLIETTCGVSGAKRILLFRYIYMVITNEYGCHFGSISESILYYLQASPKLVFPRAILAKMPDIAIREPYSLSAVPMREFRIGVYNPFLRAYFKKYYAVINTVKPAHSLTLVGMNSKFIYVKDSSSGKLSTIPVEQFHDKGEFTIGGEEYSGISFILFLFESSTLSIYPDVVTESLVEKEFGVPHEFPESPIDFREAADKIPAPSIADLDGGKKSRKRKKKTKRKRSRKN